MEQTVIQNHVRVNGVPIELCRNDNTDTSNLVCDIAREIGVEIQPDDIELSHFNSKPSPSGRQILVEFKHHANKVKFLKSRQKLRTSMKFRSVYLNEDLTPARYALLKKLIELRKDKKLFSAWTYNGTIFYKLLQKDRPAKIDDVIRFDISTLTNNQ